MAKQAERVVGKLLESEVRDIRCDRVVSGKVERDHGLLINERQGGGLMKEGHLAGNNAFGKGAHLGRQDTR